MEVDRKGFNMFSAETLNEITGFTSGKLTFGVSAYKPGPPPGFHAHVGEGEECAEIYCILKGTAILYVGDDKRELRMRPGMWIYIPPNGLHGFWVDGNEDLVMLILLTPAPVRILGRQGIIK